MITKTIQFDDDVLQALRMAEWSDGNLKMRIHQQLDRNLYIRVNKALEAMGGKWNRSQKAHIFPEDPFLKVEGLLKNGSLEVVKDGFYETPRGIVSKMITLARVTHEDLVLEPSAGLGAIARVVSDVTKAEVVCIEQDFDRCDVLINLGFEVICDDFLAQKPHPIYDVVLMNPPFENQQDIDHVMHAYEFLKRNGRLVSIMSEGFYFRDNKKSKDFRWWLGQIGGKSSALSDGAFRESGTLVKTRIVAIGT